MLWGGVAHAHSGPPFPVMVDKMSGPYKVSLWADPDVGTGSLIIILESPTKAPLTVEPTQVEVKVQPVSKRLVEKTYRAERQNNRDSPHYFVETSFDKQEMWRLQIVLHDAGKVDTLTTQVEATPDDLGPVGILLYAFPFVAIGLVWGRAILKDRRASQPAQQSSSS